MQPFSTYVGSIERLVGTVLSSGFDGLHIQTTHALDGEPGKALRESIDLGTRRSIGAFFSGSGLSDELVGTFTRPIGGDSRILDPACGSGDLLLACSRRLPIEGNLGLKHSTLGGGSYLASTCTRSSFVLLEQGWC